MSRQVPGGAAVEWRSPSPQREDESVDGIRDDGTRGAGPREHGTRDDGRRQLRRRLGRSDLRAVSEVRGALRDLLRNWGRPGKSEVAELLTSELVTNALVHTDRDAVLTATVGPRGLRVEVRDFVGRRPRVRAPDVGDGTHGRGLMLVQSLADAWGVRAHGVGKVVWFELDGGAA
ncbi:ATP-binding protein [Streptomyces sp. G45]|uniref:ATP-binding protein n=1 Tax=Streptomyces sp. G45 TaxID=3406627 RepID=UPI003C2A0577